MSKYIRVEIHFNTRRMQEDEVYYFEADSTFDEICEAIDISSLALSADGLHSIVMCFPEKYVYNFVFPFFWNDHTVDFRVKQKINADGTVVPLLPLEEFQKFKGSEVNMLHWSLNTKGVEFSDKYII